MKFLVTTVERSPVPPEIVVGMMDVMAAWAKKYTGNKKMEQIWMFAGRHGGGGIINVDSLDELDAIMAEFPLAAFAEVQIYPLVDFQASIQRAKQAMAAMMPKK